MVAEDVLPLLAMVIVQIGYAGMNTASKLAMDAGLKPLVLAAYRQIFATLAMLPFAYFMEWKTRPKITMSILLQIFACSLTAITGNQVFWFVGLEHSSLTVATALTNTLPAVTFILAVLFRQESARVKKISGQAKVVGTIVCVGGAMLLTFYHGRIINIGESSIRLNIENKNNGSHDSKKSNVILGPLFVIASSVSWAFWYITQAELSKKFPAPYTSTFMMCLMGSIQCVIIGFGANHQMSQWSLRSPFRLFAVVYAGVVGTALAFALTSWTIQKKGAVYVSVFGPLLLVICVITGWTFLHDKIYVGTIIGSVLIVGGLYAVLWGKDKEMKSNAECKEEAITQGGKQEKFDLEVQDPVK